MGMVDRPSHTPSERGTVIVSQANKEINIPDFSVPPVSPANRVKVRVAQKTGEGTLNQ